MNGRCSKNVFSVNGRPRSSIPTKSSPQPQNIAIKLDLAECDSRFRIKGEMVQVVLAQRVLVPSKIANRGSETVKVEAWLLKTTAPDNSANANKNILSILILPIPKLS